MKKFTIIAFVVALTAVFAVTAMANEWNLYGNARMATFYTSDSLKDRSALDPADRSSIKNTQWDLQVNSRIGATVKGDMIDARFEFGVNEASVTSRRLYGVWKFADGWGFKVGKDYTPITFFLSGQAFDNDSGLLRLGNAYGGRFGQLAIEGMGFKFAAITNPVGNITIVDPIPGDTITYTGAGNESYFPKLEASYQFKFGDGMSVHALGGFASQKFYFNTSDGGVVSSRSSKTVTSWMVGLGGEFNFGPMYFKPQASYYQNGGSVGWTGGVTNAALSGIAGVTSAELTSGPILLGEKVVDVNTLMGMLALGFSPTEQLTLEAGGGVVWSEGKDDFQLDDQTYYEVYLQAVYQMAPGVFVIPEIGYRDYGELDFKDDRANADLGNLFYFGAKWQINF